MFVSMDDFIVGVEVSGHSSLCDLSFLSHQSRIFLSMVDSNYVITSEDKSFLPARLDLEEIHSPSCLDIDRNVDLLMDLGLLRIRPFIFDLPP